jgi:hypothetical protein
VPEAVDANTEAAFAMPPDVGAETGFAATVMVSDAVCAEIFTVTGTVIVRPARAAGIVPTEIEVAVTAELATGIEIAESVPKLKAETATSAMRLRVVFVDICFLSIKVDPRAFPEPAWRRNGLSSDMSDCSF